ncbi:MAG: TetR/AcrR family transcriptional regulator [Candidatus Dormibacteraeota bacterium]|nr:TetR/AcrR family transcriptional regulator [Candidatus Dormibacteraeota bacterium]
MSRESDGRRERSRQSRMRMVVAAYKLFCQRGYNVPLADIASEAGASVQNLYFTFHNKQNLVGEVLQLAVLGDDRPIPPHEREWFQELRDANTPETAIRVWVSNTLPIYARVAPLAGMFQSEPDLAPMWLHSERLRLDGFQQVMREVAEKGRLKPGVTLNEAADVMFVLLSPQTYQQFISDRAWSPTRWGAWITAVLVAAIFEPWAKPGASARAHRPSISAQAGSSEQGAGY